MSIGKLSSHWKVNGTAIYEPAPDTHIMHTSISSADSGRTEDGYMHNTWVRTDMVKVNMVWKALTGMEVQNLVTLMQGKEFTLTFYEFGTERTAEVYVAEVNYDKHTDALYTEEGGICINVSANAVEL